ncbi:MAG TPA: hypothetical protein VF735_05920 [Pyrinomonadaceae bacterium]|jgi:hypothetical protein
MHKLTTHLIIALLTFVLGIAATTVWHLKRPPAKREVQLIAPNAHWEPIYFETINSVAKLSGQNDLRKTNLAEGDIEARVWWGFGLSPLEGITLRRVAGQWSAIHVKADDYYEPEKADRKELRPPKDGWQSFWQRLVSAGVLTLPDASELNCNVDGLDGGAYVVEINHGNTYRTYMYDMPSEAKCNEAKKMMEIGDIIFEEVYSQH